MIKVVNKFTTTAILLGLSFNTYALPIDWHGTFGIDTTLIDNYRYLKSSTNSSDVSTNLGTQEPELESAGNTNANFQSYIFRLRPEMIINDSATIKAELTSGYAHGGFLGEESNQRQGGNYANALYYQNQTSGTNELYVNKIYAELYSDTATYIIGRHSVNWGLGALINGGDNSWDRHAFTRDGISAKLKIGNFHITPFWANVSRGSSLTNKTKVNESGVSLLYDNKERDLSFGIFYGVKTSGASEAALNNGSGDPLGDVNVKLTDIYFKKKMGDFQIAIEAPFISGNMENAGVNGSDPDTYKAKAVLLETEYKISDSMTIGIDAGQVDGDDGADDSFTAMYLNPNFQIANLMFRYNRAAVKNADTQNVFDSYITNTTYIKLRYLLKTDRVDWNFSFIKAMANEVSTGSGTAFNHTTNKEYTSQATQSDDMGMEFDLGFTYHWNKEVTIGGSAGYMMTGDYWAFTNSTTNINEADNAYALRLHTSIDF